jgi:hypothetical protein
MWRSRDPLTVCFNPFDWRKGGKWLSLVVECSILVELVVSGGFAQKLVVHGGKGNYPYKLIRIETSCTIKIWPILKDKRHKIGLFWDIEVQFWNIVFRFIEDWYELTPVLTTQLYASFILHTTILLAIHVDKSVSISDIYGLILCLF